MSIKPPSTVSRREDGRWLGGVCAGIARSRDVHPAWIRAALLASCAVGGLGAVIYVACWLIIPSEGEAGEGAPAAGSGWIVALAQACAAGVGVVVVGAGAAAATLFGFGWIVVGLAAAILVGGLVAWTRLGPGWALLPVAALVLPSVGVAASGVRLVPRAGATIVAPVALSATAPVTVRAGLGTMLVDLRRTTLPASGVSTLHVQGGVRRTIVALPEAGCVHVALHEHVAPFASKLAAQVTGRIPLTGVEAYGNVIRSRSGVIDLTRGTAPGPWLRIDFSSLGGSLYVRDYPDSVDPNVHPNWPGYQVYPEARPDIRGTPRRAARRLIAAWRVRRAAQLRSRELIDALMPGPCARR